MDSRLMRWIFAIGMLSAFSACSSLGDFLSEKTALNWATVDVDLLSKGVLDLRIYDGMIWELGDQALALKQQISRNLNIIVDGEAVPGDEILFFEQVEVPIEEYNKENSVIGTHYGITQVYIFNLGLIEGFHTLKVEVTSTSGKIFSHIWDFEVAGSAS